MSSSTDASRAGEVELAVEAKGRTKRKLRRKGRTKLKPSVTYTPTGGSARTKGTTVRPVKRRRIR